MLKQGKTRTLVKSTQLTLACAMSLSISLFSLPSEAAQRWKLHSAYGQNVPVIGHTAQDIANTITDLSHKEIRVKAFEPGALVSGAHYFDAVSKGAITAAFGNAGYNVGKNSAYAFFAAVPFGPASAEYLAWLHYGGGQQLAEELYARDNIKFLACGIAPPETSGWFVKEIKQVKDLKGLKMRFLGLGARVMEKLGVSTQLMAGGDIYPALEIGTLDATEFSVPAVDRALGFYQIAKHNYFPGWHQQSTVQELLIHLDTWKSLTAQQQKLIETVCLAQTTAMLAEGEALQFKAMQENAANGVINHRWPDEILTSFKQAWDEVIDEEIKQNPDSRKIWRSYSDFRKNYSLWRDYGYL
ncbi:Alpha-keto acid-binding periplasmic protein TakP [Thalassocella blandensis]|nr:Alpha-keto acid-binding periplasmic protein TakP [Thalassocella blandensis]